MKPTWSITLALVAIVTFGTPACAESTWAVPTGWVNQNEWSFAETPHGPWRQVPTRHQSGSRLQCVPFARENSGIGLTGNASTWWAAAEGIYERGPRPEIGSVLNFRPTGRMPLGHVAVVSNILDSRTIQIDHANWNGGPQRNVMVIDTSADNSWTAVRVAVGTTGQYGSVYPTYGFIHNRSDRAAMFAYTGIGATFASSASVRAATHRAGTPPRGRSFIDLSLHGWPAVDTPGSASRQVHGV